MPKIRILAGFYGLEIFAGFFSVVAHCRDSGARRGIFAFPGLK